MISGGKVGMADLSFISMITWSPAYPVSPQLAKVELSAYQLLFP